LIIDVSKADVLAVYRAIVGVVTPRPIAWVTTVDGEGRVEPRPLQLLQRVRRQSAGRRFLADLATRRSKKDTLRNLDIVGEFVVNAAVEDLAEKVNATSKELPPGESEADYAGLTLEPSVKVRPPRVAESPVHLECRVCQTMSIGSGPIAANLVIGEVLLIHIADSVLDERGRRRSTEAADDRAAGGRTTTAGARTSSRWSGREKGDKSNND